MFKSYSKDFYRKYLFKINAVLLLFFFQRIHGFSLSITSVFNMANKKEFFLISILE